MADGKLVRMENPAKELAAGLDDDKKIVELACLNATEYERKRKAAAGELGCRSSVLDKLVDSKRKENEQQAETAGNVELYTGVPPWESSVNGQAIAREIRKLLRRYTVLPKGGYHAITLWVLGSYVINSFSIFPKLCLFSPEPACGKSTTMEIIGATARRGLSVSNTSASAIFRSIDLWQPTMLLDEGDTYLKDNEELRGIVDSGHKRSTAHVLRTEEIGGERIPKLFSTWAPMAIAMINRPARTITTRSVMLPLRRKMAHEKRAKAPLDLIETCYDIRRKCQRWANDSELAVTKLDPELPRLRSDRSVDNWTPLLAIAEHLGGDWPAAARKAAEVLEALEGNEESIGPMLLVDIQRVFADEKRDRLYSDDLVQRLIDLEERPWAEWRRGNPLTKNSLARLLKPYSVKSKQLNISGTNKNGYELAAFKESFSRYITPEPAPEPVSSSTTLDASKSNGCSAFQNSTGQIDVEFQNSTSESGVEFENGLQTNDHGGCRVIEDENGQNRGVGDIEDFDL